MYDPVNTSHEIFDSAETWDVYSLLAHTDSFAASLSTAKDMSIYGSPSIRILPMSHHFVDACLFLPAFGLFPASKRNSPCVMAP
jgi:hypothetical protein